MKSIVLALALGVASADYLKRADFYSNHGACDGTPSVITSTVIDCETNGATSYRVNCANSTAANLLTYLNTDCTGDPAASTPYPIDYGCDVQSDGSATTYTCEAETDFVAPSPAANTYFFNGVDACPPGAHADLSIVLSSPCGQCTQYHNEGIIITCDDSNAYSNWYTDKECSGDPYYTADFFNGLGCEVRSETQVTVSSCDQDNATKAATKAAPKPTVGVAKPKAVEEFEARLAKHLQATKDTAAAIAKMAMN